jgi:16S rRNA (adenine1518-N6/adenine1519-N6)-dimethyltransferase
MQTKREIQELLASAGVSPNRKLGQHFLVDLNLMRLLVDSAQIGSDDVVLEVGCGTGSLTEALAERAGRVVAVELDRALAPIAANRLAGRPNVQIIRGDILSGKNALNPAVMAPVAQSQQDRAGRLLLVSNLPYDVASPVMINLVKGPLVADAMYVTVQKEVAERMAAGPGGRDYGTLSILLQAAGDVRVIRALKPSVFWPPPGVGSAMVGFVRSEPKRRLIDDMAVLGQVVGLLMGHRRKMLRACIKAIVAEPGGREMWTRILARCSIDATRRPAELSPGQYVQLANAYRCDAMGR